MLQKFLHFRSDLCILTIHAWGSLFRCSAVAELRALLIQELGLKMGCRSVAPHASEAVMCFIDRWLQDKRLNLSLFFTLKFLLPLLIRWLFPFIYCCFWNAPLRDCTLHCVVLVWFWQYTVWYNRHSDDVSHLFFVSWIVSPGPPVATVCMSQCCVMSHERWGSTPDMVLFLRVSVAKKREKRTNLRFTLINERKASCMWHDRRALTLLPPDVPALRQITWNMQRVISPFFDWLFLLIVFVGKGLIVWFSLTSRWSQPMLPLLNFGHRCVWSMPQELPLSDK